MDNSNVLTSKITLIDGTQLECFPVALHPEIVKNDNLTPDTTGEYLHVSNKSRDSQKSDEDYQKEREKANRLFYEHVHLFLANADRILSDSRMFLAPVGVINGLAYTGTSGFRKPTLGVYIEWWLYNKSASIDADGRPIWYISGSPLSGRNACSSVDRKGKTRKAKLNSSFSGVWTSFMEVNRRYAEAKDLYMAFELQEVIDILEGTTNAASYFRLHLRLEKVKYDNYVTNLRNALNNTCKLATEYSEKIQRLLVSQQREAAEAYCNKCLNLRYVADLARQYFLERRIEMRRDLRNGILDNRSYQQQLTKLKKKAKDAEYESKCYEREGRAEIFGEDAYLLSFDIIETILGEKSELKTK